ncbi:MAG: hypothetical protein ACO3UU_08480 [Minisyncoccia bacterium]
MEDNSVDDLLKQLSESPRVKPMRDDSIELTGENLEEFLLKYTGKLIKDSVESIENVKDYIDSAPDAESTEALASLIKSAASSIDVLQRIMTSREKNTSSKEITKMKIESQQIQTDKEIGARLLLSREEAIKALIASSNSPTIEVESEIVE